MEKQQNASSIQSIFTVAVILTTIIVSYLVYFFVFGQESNFDAKGQPLPGNYLGIIYKGGLIVPILMSCFLMVLVFSVERLIIISKAKGQGSVNAFVRRIKAYLGANEIQDALEASEEQKGSVGNVVQVVLKKYKEVAKETGLKKEQKVATLQKELTEATALELPVLERNLSIISTLASVSTLIGLLGTVIGMIKAFAALSITGAPDTSALATGISEALINTALGIGSSALAIIAYNYFTSRIDSLTQSIDEIGFSITQNFSANYKELTSSRESEYML